MPSRQIINQKITELLKIRAERLKTNPIKLPEPKPEPQFYSTCSCGWFHLFPLFIGHIPVGPKIPKSQYKLKNFSKG